jgi:hypothetical protein
MSETAGGPGRNQACGPASMADDVKLHIEVEATGGGGDDVCVSIDLIVKRDEEREPIGIVIRSNCGLDGRDRIKADRIATLAAIFFRDIGELITESRAPSKIN